MPQGTGGSNPSLSATLSLADKEGQIKPSTMEKYPSGRRGSPAKGVGCVSAARVQIPASPPKPCQTMFRQGPFYVWKGKIPPKAPNSFFCPMKNDCHFQTDAESEHPLRACFLISFNLTCPTRNAWFYCFSSSSTTPSAGLRSIAPTMRWGK